MTKEQEQALKAIAAQQPKERSAVWMVGEQLKDMVRAEPETAALIAADLAGAGMTLADAEKKIAEAARKNKVGNVGCVTPAEADEILRKFYGLPQKQERETAAREEDANETPELLDLADFL